MAIPQAKDELVISIKNTLVKLFLFDEQKQALFLSIVSSQLKSGRPYQAIFKSLLKSKNTYYQLLAKKSLNPKSAFFASEYGDLFPHNTARLLELSQRFNAVSEFIDESINTDKKSISIVSTVLLPRMLEVVLALIASGLFIALYLYNERLAATLADLSDTVAYAMGDALYNYKAVYISLFIALSAMYFFWQNRAGEFRQQMKRLGFYRYHDTNFAIEVFSIIKIMTSSGITQGGSIKTLIDELSLIYGTNNLRRSQFAILRTELGRGAMFHTALENSMVLDDEALDVFRGLAPNESAEEISKASAAVATLLTVVAKAEIGYLAKSVYLGLLLYLGIAMLAVVDMTLGGGVSVLSFDN